MPDLAIEGDLNLITSNKAFHHLLCKETHTHFQILKTSANILGIIQNSPLESQFDFFSKHTAIQLSRYSLVTFERGAVVICKGRGPEKNVKKYGLCHCPLFRDPVISPLALVFLAPTGALIVIVVYYITSAAVTF